MAEQGEAELTISADAARIREQALLGAWPNYLLGFALVVLYFVFEQPYALIMGVLVLINGALAVLAYRRAGENRVAGATLLLNGMLWPICLLLTAAGPLIIPVALSLALLPLVAVSAHFTPRVVAFISAATGVVVLASVAVVITDAQVVEPFPDEYLRLFAVIGGTIITGMLGLTIWQTNGALVGAIDELRSANQELVQSEQNLEAEVERRTAELERSRGELAGARDLALLADARQAGFLANVSHELRTPLNAIIGFSEMLQEQYFGELNVKQAEYVGDIHGSGIHLLSLINDVLDLSAVETGELTITAGPVNVAAMVDNALVLMKERAARTGVEIVADIDPELETIRADERKLKQVVINLLSNAVKFTPSGGTVTLSMRSSPRGLEVAVADTGVGIPADQLGAIFDEFRQTDAGRVAEGTGLGLSLSKRIIEAHGGTITATSEPRVGSTFTVVLPDGLATEAPTT